MYINVYMYICIFVYEPGHQEPFEAFLVVHQKCWGLASNKQLWTIFSWEAFWDSAGIPSNLFHQCIETSPGNLYI